MSPHVLKPAQRSFGSADDCKSEVIAEYTGQAEVFSVLARTAGGAAVPRPSSPSARCAATTATRAIGARIAGSEADLMSKHFFEQVHLSLGRPQVDVWVALRLN